MFRNCILLLAAVVSIPGLFAQDDPEVPSVRNNRPPDNYVDRVMSRDADGDGLLSGDEIPAPLARDLPKYDLNKDGRLGREELSKISTPPAPAERGAGQRGRRPPPRTGNRSADPDPEMVSQILMFALTFDQDGDGGLNEKELEHYAVALSERRRQNRARSSAGKPLTGAEESQLAPKGLGAPGTAADSGFGASPKQKPE